MLYHVTCVSQLKECIPQLSILKYASNDISHIASILGGTYYFFKPGVKNAATALV